jgi:putative phosphoribosyl transferase
MSSSKSGADDGPLMSPNMAGPNKMRFSDLRSAGSELALQLMDYSGRDDVVVLGIVLGGVPVAHEVARSLGAPLDLVVIRRLLAPPRPSLPTCAVNLAGTEVIDKALPPRAKAPTAGLDYFIEDALKGLDLRAQLCRGERAPLALTSKKIVLVDCGLNTGGTMQVTIDALRTQRPEKIIAAAPVASRVGFEAVAALADELICLAQHEPFGHVGLWYADFSRPGDEGVAELL